MKKTANYKSPQQVLSLFKGILREAAKFYGKPAHSVTGAEFKLVSQCRLGDTAMMKLGGYSKLREYVAPGPDSKMDERTKALLKRILSL